MSPLVTKSIIIACAKTPNTTTVTGCKQNIFLTFYYIVIVSSAGECAGECDVSTSRAESPDANTITGARTPFQDGRPAPAATG